MNDRSYIMRSDKLIVLSDSWVVLQNNNSYSVLIKLNIDKLVIRKMATKNITEGIENGTIILDTSHKENNKVIDTNFLSDACRRKYNQSVNILEYINNNYMDLEWLMDSNERALLIKSISQEFNMSINSVRRRLRDYLQGGMSISALIPQYINCGKKQRIYISKKPGPQKGSIIVRNKETEEIFTKMTSRYLASKTKMSFIKLYEDMVAEFYSDKQYINSQIIYKKYPKALRPSIYSLKNWILTHTDEVERETIRNGKKAARNNFRPTFSDTIDYLDVKSIGSRFEMDEVETDFYLVNRKNRKRVIGRAIVYFIVDVFSKVIISCGIGLDNNSWSGAEIALLNMVENKKDFCSQYGISINENQWPIMNIISRSLLVDNGSEYLSKNFSNLTHEIGIGIDYVPPQMGSFKGNVESKFHQINLQLKGELPGLIEREQYGQPHIRNARLDIVEFSKIVIEFILNYNNSPMDYYPDNAEMFANEIVLTPVNIWNYCCTRYNELTYIRDIDTFKYSLLKQDKATITQNGIEYKGRYFICNDMEWLRREASLAALTNTKKIVIRYDMRFPDVIYYERSGCRYKAYLNSPEVIAYHEIKTNSGCKTANSKYAGITEPEIRDMLKAKNQQKEDNFEERLENNINTNSAIKKVVKEAKKMHREKNDSNNINENRIEEKKNLHNENHIDIDTNKIDIIMDTSINQSDPEINKLSRAEKFRWIEQHR